MSLFRKSEISDDLGVDVSEWLAERSEAIEAVPMGPAYRIWRDVLTGWWRVGYRSVETLPSSFTPRRHRSGKVTAYAYYPAFEPKHEPLEAAELWLKAYASTPRAGGAYDASGRRIEDVA